MLIALAISLILQSEKPASVPAPEKQTKIEIAPPQLDRDRTIKAVMPFNTPVKRYEFESKVDKLDSSQTRSLFLHVMSSMWDAGRGNVHENSQHWIFRAVLDDVGERYSIEYGAIAWDGAFSLGTETQLTKDQFTLRYKAEPKAVSVPAVSAERSVSDGLYRTLESVRFEVQREQLLAIADGGMLRMVYGDRQVNLELDPKDVEALRWFVWEKVKGGKELMRARYTIVDKPKAEPAAAPKPDAAKDKPAPAPKVQEKPTRAA